MPDPLLYLAAIGAAALTAALLMAAISWRDTTGTRDKLAVAVGIGGGLFAGYWVLDLYISWPPVNALDRFLTIILPLAIGIEILAAIESVPRWLAWALRMTLVAAMGRILLHGSVYLTTAHPFWQIALTLIVCGSLTMVLWLLLTLLAARLQRSTCIPIGLALTLVVSGFLIMISGYVSGGAATLPLSSSLAAATVMNALLLRGSRVEAALGIGVIGLSGLLLIGRFFGGLSTSIALLLLLSPLLCWSALLFELFRRNRLAEHGQSRTG